MQEQSSSLSDEVLLAQCTIETYRASGPGGQHVNKTNSAVRLIYRPYGIVVSSQKERSQYLNKLECLKKLRKKIQQLNYRPPKRIPTRIPKSVRKKDLEKKTRHGAKKKLRQKVQED